VTANRDAAKIVAVSSNRRARRLQKKPVRAATPSAIGETGKARKRKQATARRLSRDRLSPQRRSENMARIPTSHTTPERIARSMLHALGFRFRLHRRDLPGRPDIVLPKHQTAIFVHGCFWHLHPGCNAGRLPTAHRDFWKNKLEGNRVRDRRTRRRLREMGWAVLTIWECQLERNPVRVQETLRRSLIG
jgi:DNA mismatch endonuclease (patch repair protein)